MRPTGFFGGGTILGGTVFASFFTEASVPFALGATGLLGGGIVALGAAAALGLCLAGN